MKTDFEHPCLLCKAINNKKAGSNQVLQDPDSSCSGQVCSSCGLCLAQQISDMDTKSDIEDCEVLEGDMSYIKWKPMWCPITRCKRIISKSSFAMHYLEQICINFPPVQMKLGKLIL